MEAVGARLGRSSSRYGGPTTVFTGPVRKWKKKWIHVAPSSASNGNSSGSRDRDRSQSADGGSNGGKSNVMLYKWTPISERESSGGGVDETTPVKDGEERSRKKLKFIPIALLEEQKSEASEHAEEDIKATEADPDTDEQASKDKTADEKLDMNDAPMKDTEEIGAEEEQEERQDLNMTTLDLNDEEKGSPEVTTGLLDSVQRIHALIDAGIASRTDPINIFVCELSHGGRAAIFSAWIPANASLLKKVTSEAKKVYMLEKNTVMLQTLRLWCNGTDDPLIPFETGKAGQRFLKKVYPGLKHALIDEELLYLRDWIKSHLGSPLPS